MLEMRINSRPESVLAPLYEVASAATMSVHINAAGDYISPLGIDDFGSDHMKVDVRDGSDSVAVGNNGAAIKPSLGVRMRPLTNCFNIVFSV